MVRQLACATDACEAATENQYAWARFRFLHGFRSHRHSDGGHNALLLIGGLATSRAKRLVRKVSLAAWPVLSGQLVLGLAIFQWSVSRFSIGLITVLCGALSAPAL